LILFFKLIAQHNNTYKQIFLAEDLSRGTEIFCSSNENVQKWECEEVLHFLRHECIQAIVPYLEHVIYQNGEKRPKLHETLAEQYIVKVKQLMKDYVHALSDSEFFLQRFPSQNAETFCSF
jgi:hypothetical protein